MHIYLTSNWTNNFCLSMIIEMMIWGGLYVNAYQTFLIKKKMKWYMIFFHFLHSYD
jgi:hypothetical protein